MKTVTFHGIQVYVGGISNVLADIDAILSLGTTIRIHLCNAYTFALTKESPEIRASLISADLNLPDGLPLSKAISPFKNVQIRGMELLKSIMTDPKSSTMLHVFYGVREGQSDIFERRLKYLFGDSIRIHIVSAPFASLESLNLAELRDVLAMNRPDFIWIGMGTPKQDFLVDKIFSWSTHPCVIIPIGAVFDFVLESTPEAPSFVRKIGMEWLYRWMREPQRLTKRYTKYNFIFAMQVLKFILQRLRIAINRFKRSE